MNASRVQLSDDGSWTDDDAIPTAVEGAQDCKSLFVQHSLQRAMGFEPTTSSLGTLQDRILTCQSTMINGYDEWSCVTDYGLLAYWLTTVFRVILTQL